MVIWQEQHVEGIMDMVTQMTKMGVRKKDEGDCQRKAMGLPLFPS